ncbi:hypothetical protein AMK59_3314 [Oryctes borbonicus]|uniref:Uncharacterized protein n=1 Tax=Oryctes borbonicus TaxID=1629725 RepID=A0A0T6B6S3_9SCAR|nr:hypothetical protein AMK59_3314 [Oryctes borbonicus]
MKNNYIFFIFFMFNIISTAFALWCYECVSNEPGCGKEFNWWWHWTKVCPENDDICVKIIEKKDSEEVITRGCLSTIQGYRRDIPADHYEGCRPAAINEQLGHYVKNSIKELDVHRTYYQNTTFCFCFLDHRCNDGSSLKSSLFLVSMILLFSYYRII